MHLKSIYLFIKQMYKCTDDVQEKVNEESVNKASYQLDLGGHFCLQKVHAQNMGGM